MTKEEKLKAGLALNAIAMMVDDETFIKIKDRLKEIEEIITKQEEE